MLRRLLLLLLLPTLALAKRTRGYFRLSGVNTEKILSSFVVGNQGGRLTVRLGIDDPYPNDQHIKFRVYNDTNWSKVKKATLCTDKIKYAMQTVDLAFVLKGDGPMVPKGGKWQVVKTVTLADPKDESTKIDSPRYYYFAVDDCSLEQYLQDGAVPNMYYEITTWNYYGKDGSRKTTQMSYDEGHLLFVHEWSFILGLVVFLWLVSNVIFRVARKKSKRTVHAAALWITVAAGLDCFSSLSEIGHLEMYHYNGYGNYALDCLATQLEALCDALIVLFLISIGNGWTLPSDMISSSGSTVQHLIQDVAKPLSGVMKLNATGIASGFVIIMHMALAQWGRTYNDDFDTYHSYSHLPGKILMIFRVCMGMLFLGSCMQTGYQAKVPSLKQFYGVLAFLGFVWFQGLPFITFICNWMLPFHWQHPAVFWASATLQLAMIFLLAWLVTWQNSSYHQYSHMAASPQAGLGESLGSMAQPREWSVMGKAKVRFD